MLRSGRAYEPFLAMPVVRKASLELPRLGVQQTFRVSARESSTSLGCTGRILILGFRAQASPGWIFGGCFL